jgi:transposase
METKPQKTSPENFAKEISRKAGRLFTTEQKILIVMEAIRGENQVTEICRKYGIHQTRFYKWNKQFLEAGKKLLAGDTIRETTTDEVVELRKENQRLKEMVADLMLRYDNVKKSLS